MKYLAYLAGLIVGVIVLVVAQVPSSKLRMVVCDVGQGDAILLIKGSAQVLIDGGPSEAKMLACLGEQLPFWDHKIELIVMTHGDYDHSNGLVAVLERYTVMQFVTADGIEESDITRKLADRIEQRGVSTKAVQQGDYLRVLGPNRIELKVLWPPEVEAQFVALLTGEKRDGGNKQILGASAKKRDLNERSVVLSILEDNSSILLMGDVGFQAEKEMVQGGWIDQSDYIKVGHHGSKYATSRELLEKVRPREAIISVGAGNRYGHPTAEVLERLKAVGAKVTRTDETGTIEYE